MSDFWTKIKNLISSLKDLLSLIFSEAIVYVIFGIFGIYLASLLGAEQYGEFSYWITIASVAGTIALFGTSTTTTVVTAKKIPILSTFVLLVIGTSLIISTFVFLFFEIIEASLYVIGFTMFTLLTSELIGKKHFKLYSKFWVLRAAITIPLALLFYFTYGVLGLLLGHSLALMIVAALSYYSIKTPIEFNFELLKNNFRFLAKNYILSLVNVSASSADKLIIGPLLGFALLGNFSLGMNFLTLLTVLPTVILKYTIPNAAVGKSNNKLFYYSILLSILLAAISIVTIPILLPIVLPDYTETSVIIPIISLTIILRTINVKYVSKFLGQEQTQLLIIGTLLYISVYIILILVLSEQFGLTGVAIGLVLSSIILTIYYIIIDKKYGKKLEH